MENADYFIIIFVISINENYQYIAGFLFVNSIYENYQFIPGSIFVI